MCEQHPTVAIYKAELGSSLANRGRFFLQRGKVEQAATSFENSLNLLRDLTLAELPPELAKTPGIVKHNLSVVRMRQNRPTETRALRKEALEIYTELAQIYDGLPALQNDEATGFFTLGWIEKNDEYYRRSIAIWESMPRIETEWNIQLGGAYCNLAILLCTVVDRNNRELDEGLELFDKATETLEKVIAQRPTLDSGNTISERMLIREYFRVARPAGSVEDVRRRSCPLSVEA